MKDIFKDDVSLSRIKAVLTSLAKAGEINLCVLDVLGNPIIYPTNAARFANACAKPRTGVRNA